MKQKQWSFTLMSAATLMVIALGNPAFAGGSSGGSGGSGGGGGGNNGTTTKSLTFDDWGDFYSGMLPQGQVTFQYNASGSSRSMQVQVSNINVADGTVMLVETQEVWSSATGNTVIVTYYPVMIQKGKGNLSLTTTNGDNVAFLLPSVGETVIYVCPSPPKGALMGTTLGKIG